MAVYNECRTVPYCKNNNDLNANKVQRTKNVLIDILVVIITLMLMLN